MFWGSKVKWLALLLILFPLQSLACLKNCKADRDSLRLITSFEGFSPFVYKDIVGIDTVGFGHALKPGEHFPEPMTGYEAQTLLESDVALFQAGINRLVKADLTKNRFAALLDYTFNLGVYTLQKSSVLAYVNAKRHKEVPSRLILYDRAGGRVSNGLLRRREAEGTLYITP